MSKITLDNYEAFLLDFSEGKLSGEELRELDRFFAIHPELDQRAELSDLPQLPVHEESFIQKSELFKSDIYLEDEKLIAYLEGLCSSDEALRFEEELKTNDSLRKQLTIYKATRLQAEPVQFERSMLYKTDDDLLLNDPSINYIEGCLSETDQKAFELELVSSSSLKKEVLLLSKTKLITDHSLVFENKESLKKEATVIVLFSWKTVARVAAILVLVFSILIPFYLKNDGIDPLPKTVATKTPEKKLNEEDNNLKGTEAIDQSKNTTDKVAVEKEKTEQRNFVSDKVREEKKENAKDLLETQDKVQSDKPQSDQEPTHQKQNTPEPALLANVEQVKSNSPLKDSLPILESFASIDDLKFTEELEEVETGKAEKGFWGRAVSLAKQANKLGVKSIDGEENTGVKFRVKIKSFSVEKR